MAEKIVKTEKVNETAAKKKSFRWQDYLIANFKTVIGLAAAVIFLVGYFFILSPKYEDINKKIAEAGESIIEKDVLKTQLNRLEKTKKQYEEIDAYDLEKIDWILPDSPGKDELISQLEGLILRNGLLMTSLQIEEVKEARRVAPTENETPPVVEERKTAEESLSPDIGKIKIAMDIVGTDYDNLKRILVVIENNIRLLDVTKMTFSPDSSKTSLEMFAYYLKKK